MDFTNLNKKYPQTKKSRDFCQMFVISKKKTIPESIDLNIYRKPIA